MQAYTAQPPMPTAQAIAIMVDWRTMPWQTGHPFSHEPTPDQPAILGSKTAAGGNRQERRKRRKAERTAKKRGR